MQLGGPGSIVEIDESLFSRRKYNRGRIVEDQWIFGGYNIATKEGLLIPVSHRDAATLLSIIIQWIRPGTEIWSFMWAAYRGLAAQGFQHGTVNHTLHLLIPQQMLQQTGLRQCGKEAKPNLKLCLAYKSRNDSRLFVRIYVGATF